jgi:hypothetical protein
MDILPGTSRAPRRYRAAARVPGSASSARLRNRSIAAIDLTIPYTFYPLALPHWISWTLVLSAITIGAVAGLVRARLRGWTSGLFAGLVGGVCALLASVVVSMIIAFFVHDL